MKTWTKAACLALCAGLLVSGVAAGLQDPTDDRAKQIENAIKQAQDAQKRLEEDTKKAEAESKKAAKEYEAALLVGMQEESKPVAQHDIIKTFAGTWNADVKLWMGGPEPRTSKATMKATLLHGGRYLLGEFTGEFLGGTFTGTMLWAYNRTDARYESSWCDSINTAILNTTGKPSADGKTVDSTGTFRMPGPDGKPVEFTQREKVTMISKDSYRLEMWHSSKDSPETKVMEINYTRAEPPTPGAAPVAPGGAGITMPPATR